MILNPLPEIDAEETITIMTFTYIVIYSSMEKTINKHIWGLIQYEDAVLSV